jgi:hypothetical protein
MRVMQMAKSNRAGWLGAKKAESRARINDKGPKNAPRRRSLIASIAVALVFAGSAAMLPSAVTARGPSGGSPYAILPTDGASSPVNDPLPDATTTPEHKSAASGRSVCVRLCDGAFFPIAGDSGHDQEAACEAVCPDAPTALYRERAGSDRIEDAVSASGAPYTALPVALRYRTTLDNSCTCHRARAQQYSILRDPTLRKGDTVMTPNGFVVFQGSRQSPYAQSDFATLADAPMSKDQRAALMAMQRASTDVSENGADKSAAAVPFQRPAPPAQALNLSAPQHSRPATPAGSN